MHVLIDTNVLLHRDVDMVSVLCNMSGLSREDVCAFVFGENIITPEQCYSTTQQVLDRRCIEQLVSYWHDQLCIVNVAPGSHRILRNLTVPWSCIANTWYPEHKVFQRYFGDDIRVTTSYQEGVLKPNKRLFEVALRGIDPSNCVMVGSSYEEDMAPAIDLGMKTVWLNGQDLVKDAYKVLCGTLASPDLILPSLNELTMEKLKCL